VAGAGVGRGSSGVGTIHGPPGSRRVLSGTGHTSRFTPRTTPAPPPTPSPPHGGTCGPGGAWGRAEGAAVGRGGSGV
ncbi:hypothetical protein VR43_37190, partial [Streptomyces sp. NRRL S-104]